MNVPFLPRQSRHKLRFPRQLSRCPIKCFTCHGLADTIDLEQDTPWLNPTSPELNRPLAAAHTYLGRLARYRHVGKHADPHAPDALNMSRNCPARSLNLPGGNTLR